MQISTRNGNGTVSIITTPTNRVIGNALADWTEVVAGLSRFSLIGDTAIPFPIQAKTAPGASASGFWEVTLAGSYVGPTVAGAAYAIHKDFTPLRGLPLLDPGDVQRSQISNEAMWILDGISGGGGGGGVILLSTLAIPTLTLPKPSLFGKVITESGTDVLQWWLLETGAPTASDTATIDDATSRWRQVG